MALLLLVGVAFGRVVTFDFLQWDDDINITQNPLLTSIGSWSLLPRFFDADQTLRFKPLHWFMDRGLHATFGFDPVAWHALNLGLHGMAAVLFYLVLRRLISLLENHPGEPASSHATLAAAFAAAFWAVHPLRVEVVAWATASTYAFTTVWLLGSFACYLESIARLRSGRWLALSAVLAVAAFASYPVALSYGLLLIVVDEGLRRRGVGRLSGEIAVEVGRRRWVLAALFLLPAAVAATFTVWSRFSRPGIFAGAPSLDAVNLGTRIDAALASLMFLAGRLVWPFHLTPNVPPMRITAVESWTMFALGVVALAGLLLAWARRRRWPGVATICFGFAVLSLPCLGLTERPAWPVDRYSYIAHLPLIAGSAVLMAGQLRHARVARWLVPAAAIAISASAVAAFRQTSIWRNSETLFTHMTQDRKLADNPRQEGHIYILWARHEADVGRQDRALERRAQAREIYLSAIRAAVARGNYAEALSLSTHLERYFPLEPAVHRERGAWLLRLSRPTEARAELQLARAALPGDERVAQLLREADGEKP